jgi:hypothetical protein
MPDENIAGPIQNALNSQDDLIDELFGAIDCLEQRLGPVRVPRQDESPSEIEKESCESPVHNRILANTKRIIEARLRLNDLTGSLDL